MQQQRSGTDESLISSRYDNSTSNSAVWSSVLVIHPVRACLRLETPDLAQPVTIKAGCFFQERRPETLVDLCLRLPEEPRLLIKIADKILKKGNDSFDVLPNLVPLQS